MFLRLGDPVFHRGSGRVLSLECVIYGVPCFGVVSFNWRAEMMRVFKLVRYLLSSSA